MPLDFVLPREQLHALQTGALAVPDRPALFRVEGPGALDCLQGLLTHDLVGAGAESLSYGAILTAKGMILLDPLALRENGAVILVLPAAARETAVAHFRRVLPPRLARVTDQSEAWEAIWLLGAEAPAHLGPGLDLPPPGRVIRAGEGSAPVYLARGTALMPFSGLLIGGSETLRPLGDRLAAMGTLPAGDAALAASRVLAGWPTLGREIDEKTLPQEVRYDELGAVSYSKGCYTGQETVARVHFRGHTNRLLRGAMLTAEPDPENRRLFLQNKEVGVLRTTIHSNDRRFALATVRRDVPEDATLEAHSARARMVVLPIREGVAA
jgi:folate-binding protein YgfZ